MFPVDSDETIVQRKLHAVHMVYKEGDSKEADKNGSATGSASSGSDDGESAASGLDGARLGPFVAVVVGVFIGAGLLFR